MYDVLFFFNPLMEVDFLLTTTIGCCAQYFALCFVPRISSMTAASNMLVIIIMVYIHYTVFAKKSVFACVVLLTFSVFGERSASRQRLSEAGCPMCRRSTTYTIR